MKLIDADKLLKQSQLEPMGNGEYKEVWVVYEEDIDNAPAVEQLTADELINILKDYRFKSGKWIAKERGHGWDCSECGYELWTYGSRNYCPHCGAKMEERR